MEPTTIITAAAIAALTKASEKAGGNIGDKLTQISFWKKFKHLFIKEEEIQIIKTIEAKNVIDAETTTFIEQKITDEIKQNPAFAQNMKKLLGITPTKETKISNKLKSIGKLKKTIAEKEDNIVGYAHSINYKAELKSLYETLEYQEKELTKIFDIT